mmetsp:Transcript_22970/g.37314  ORF Transcript_22970/g.37314 Transcript_22970/m.37314 type:complete len:89 (-) Transcript_22970:772-1038(-)
MGTDCIADAGHLPQSQNGSQDLSPPSSAALSIPTSSPVSQLPFLSLAPSAPEIRCMIVGAEANQDAMKYFTKQYCTSEEKKSYLRFSE